MYHSLVSNKNDLMTKVLCQKYIVISWATAADIPLIHCHIYLSQLIVQAKFWSLPMHRNKPYFTNLLGKFFFFVPVSLHGRRLSEWGQCVLADVAILNWTELNWTELNWGTVTEVQFIDLSIGISQILQKYLLYPLNHIHFWQVPLQLAAVTPVRYECDIQLGDQGLKKNWGKTDLRKLKLT